MWGKKIAELRKEKKKMAFSSDPEKETHTLLFFEEKQYTTLCVCVVWIAMQGLHFV